MLLPPDGILGVLARALVTPVRFPTLRDGACYAE